VEAARRHHRQRDAIDDARDEQRGGHRSGVPSPFATLHDDDVGPELLRLRGVPRIAAGRHADDARILQALDQIRARRAV
jgi:hypothetical protein